MIQFEGDSAYNALIIVVGLKPILQPLVGGCTVYNCGAPIRGVGGGGEVTTAKLCVRGGKEGVLIGRAID